MNESYQNGPSWRIFKINMGLIRTDFVDDLFIEFPGRPLWCESSLCIALADSRPGAGNVYLTTQQCLSCNKVQKCSSDNKSRKGDMISRAFCVILDISDPKIQALSKWSWQQACIKFVLEDIRDWQLFRLGCLKLLYLQKYSPYEAGVGVHKMCAWQWMGLEVECSGRLKLP